ncbi:MAG: hypothetical protein D6826_01205 [Alphaproteobacteria bacterium]|nr:MAG: hypothetical protein D6826_01205 [Alphaproteobacteria bacterium]
MSKVWQRCVDQWRDVANFALGIWLVVSPWALAYAAHQAAAWNAYVLGVVIAVAAFAALIAFHEWEEWVNTAFAVWLIISPWALGYATVSAALWNQIIVGLVVGGLALWSAFARRAQAQAAAKT